MSGITDGVKNFLKVSQPSPYDTRHSLTLQGSNKENTTEVCQETAPEVVQEHIRPQEHVETAEAIDREKHIHHHQVGF